MCPYSIHAEMGENIRYTLTLHHPIFKYKTLIFRSHMIILINLNKVKSIEHQVLKQNMIQYFYLVTGWWSLIHWELQISSTMVNQS